MKFLEFLSEGVNDPAIFKVVFLAGGPGSGKSFMAKKTGLQSMGFVTINSDDAFEHMMRKGGLDFKMPESEKQQRDAVRDVAKATTNKKQDLALQGRLGLVIDGTGKDYDKIKKLKDKLEKLGYDSSMLFINTDLDTALTRNAKRDRSVPEDMAKQLWSDVQNNIGKFQQEFGSNFHVVDNSEGADFESQTNTAFKNISKWSKSAPKNPVAKEWINSQTTPVPVLKDKDSEEKSAETPAPAAQAKTEPAAKDTAAAPTNAPAADSAAPAQQQTTAQASSAQDSSRGTGIYHIKMSKKGETNLKVTTVKAQNEDEALKLVRSHGYVPLEINHRTVTQRVGESVLPFSSYLQESACDFISAQQLKDLEKFGDRLLQKFGIDVEFTKHFGERMSDARNKPCIKVAELQSLFKKIGKDKGSKIKQHADHEAVLKDLQSDLNLPFVAKPTKDGEIDLVLKTIMRKQDFKSPDPEVRYEDLDEPSTEYLSESEYQGKQVELNKPFRTPGGPKKFAVYVKNDSGNVVIVRFGDPNMEIKRDDPERRKNFRARHNCADAKDKTTPRYWSCYQWRASAPVAEEMNGGDDPCWKDYEMIGTKKKNGKTVPNCVPKESCGCDDSDICPECQENPCTCEETISEGRPSQRHPLEGHPYHSKSDAELNYIGKDAHKAAQAMRGHNTDAENKYMDQANDAATVRYWRQKNGTPAWYKKKYGLKEEIAIPLYMQEAAYAGNIGMMELVKFYQKSTDAEKKHLQDLIKKGMAKEAWKLVQDKTGVKLVGKEFHEETELAEFFGISAKDKGHIQHVASQVSDVPGHWDHKKQTFTDKGHAELHKRLNGNQKHIKYAKSLTHKDYEAESFKEDVDRLSEYASDLEKMKKSDSYKVGDRVMVKAGGRWNDAIITKPKNPQGNYGIRLTKAGGNYLASVDQLRLVSEDASAAVAANSVAAGGVDMNPTGVGKWDKRSKFHINHMFRRADGTKYGKGRVLKEKE